MMKNGDGNGDADRSRQQRTIQFIKDCRDKLENCMDGLIYALQIMAELYGLAPSGQYEVEYGFGDIIYSYEEERQTGGSMW
ncbi:hypothetical protein [Blautia sp. LMAG:75]|uniref:hypothetical protein n=1 Tax=Blautia sp. LMAG:75 TaxID=1969171 RepID=UPI0025B8FDD7|nr:hypothetical protein [Blautia sp. LMAG:75]